MVDGFKLVFIFIPKIGEDSHFDEQYFSKLKPPTSHHPCSWLLWCSWSSWLWSPLVIVKNTSIINTESHFVKFEIGQLWDVCFEWLCQSFVRFSNSLDNGYGHRSGFVKDLSGLRKINIPMLASQNRCFVNQARLRLSQAEGGATEQPKKTHLHHFLCSDSHCFFALRSGSTADRGGPCGSLWGGSCSPPPRWKGGGSLGECWESGVGKVIYE